MAGKFEKGQHLFFLMCGGKTQLDSQNKPRYYFSRDRAKSYAQENSEVVEYAPVKYGSWLLVDSDGSNATYECSECGHRKWADIRFDLNAFYCGKCGAKMG